MVLYVIKLHFSNEASHIFHRGYHQGDINTKWAPSALARTNFGNFIHNTCQKKYRRSNECLVSQHPRKKMFLQNKSFDQNENEMFGVSRLHDEYVIQNSENDTNEVKETEEEKRK